MRLNTILFTLALIFIATPVQVCLGLDVPSFLHNQHTEELVPGKVYVGFDDPSSLSVDELKQQLTVSSPVQVLDGRGSSPRVFTNSKSIVHTYLHSDVANSGLFSPSGNTFQIVAPVDYWASIANVPYLNNSLPRVFFDPSLPSSGGFWQSQIHYTSFSGCSDPNHVGNGCSQYDLTDHDYESVNIWFGDNLPAKYFYSLSIAAANSAKYFGFVVYEVPHVTGGWSNQGHNGPISQSCGVYQDPNHYSSISFDCHDGVMSGCVGVGQCFDEGLLDANTQCAAYACGGSPPVTTYTGWVVNDPVQPSFKGALAEIDQNLSQADQYAISTNGVIDNSKLWKVSFPAIDGLNPNKFSMPDTSTWNRWGLSTSWTGAIFPTWFQNVMDTGLYGWQNYSWTDPFDDIKNIGYFVNMSWTVGGIPGAFGTDNQNDSWWWYSNLATEDMNGNPLPWVTGLGLQNSFSSGLFNGSDTVLTVGDFSFDFGRISPLFPAIKVVVSTVICILCLRIVILPKKRGGV